MEGSGSVQVNYVSGCGFRRLKNIGILRNRIRLRIRNTGLRKSEIRSLHLLIFSLFYLLIIFTFVAFCYSKLKLPLQLSAYYCANVSAISKRRLKTIVNLFFIFLPFEPQQFPPERIEWFNRAKVICGRMIRLQARLLSPSPSASCLSFSVFLCVAGPAYSRERGGRVGHGRGAESYDRNKACHTLNRSVLSGFLAETNDLFVQGGRGGPPGGGPRRRFGGFSGGQGGAAGPPPMAGGGGWG